MLRKDVDKLQGARSPLFGHLLYGTNTRYTVIDLERVDPAKTSLVRITAVFSAQQAANERNNK
jgi:hypothetical protein